MPLHRQAKCPKCGKAPRYARPSLKRPVRDAEGNPVIKDKEVLMEMAYVCRGCGELFYQAQDGKIELPRAAREMLEKAGLIK